MSQSFAGRALRQISAAELLPDSPEGARRQVDWERQIDALDARETELHHNQLRLVREQTSTFVRDLSNLRQEVAALKARQDLAQVDIAASAHQEALHEAMRRFVDDAKSAHELFRSGVEGSLQQRLAEHVTASQERLDYFEKVLDDCADRNLRQQEALRLKLEERLSYVEKILGDSADGQRQESASLRTQVEQLTTRLAASEGAKQALQARQTSLEERTEYLEGIIGDSSKQKAWQSALARVDQIQAHVTERFAGIATALDGEELRRAQDIAALESRLERAIARLEEHGEAHDGHRDSLEELRNGHAAFEERHASHAERMALLERAAAETSELLGKELGLLREVGGKHAGHIEALSTAQVEHRAALEAHLDRLHATLAAEREARESHHGALREHLTGELQARDEHHSAWKERVLQLEAMLSEHSERHSEALVQHRATAEERLQYLEQVLGDSADKHREDLAAARAELEQLLHGHLTGERVLREEHHASMAERVDFLEKALGDSAEKHLHEIEVSKQQLEQRLSDEREAREAHHGSLADLFGQERQVRDLHHQTLTQRLEQLEELIGAHADRHGRDLEAHRSAHSKLAGEVKAKEAVQASLEERLDFLEKALGDSVDRHSKAHDAASARIEVMYERLGLVERHGGQLQECHKALQTLGSQKANLESLHGALRGRVDYLESLLNEHSEQHTKAIEAVRVANSKLAGEGKARDTQQAASNERLAHLERVLGEFGERQTEEHTSASARLDELGVRVAACEAFAGQIEILKKASAAQASDRTVRDARDASVAERLDYLEKALVDAADAHAQDLAMAHGKLDQLQTRLTDERVARESLRSLVTEQVSRERQMREDQDAALEERLGQLTRSLGESAEKQSRELQAAHGHLHGKLGLLEKRLIEEAADIRETIAGEKQLRAQHHDALIEQIEGERRAREVYERTVQGHIAAERKSREGGERIVQEQLVTERAARDRQHEHVQELIAREREARLKYQDTMQESLQRESMTREAALKGFYEGLSKERALREQQHAMVQDAFQREQQARGRVEAALGQEQEEREKGCEALAERVDSLQRSVTIFDSLLRRESDDRTKETRRIWDAIDNHTHDLSTQILELDASGQEVAAGEPLKAELVPNRITVAPRVVQTAMANPTYTWTEPTTLSGAYPATVVRPLTQPPAMVITRPAVQTVAYGTGPM